MFSFSFCRTDFVKHLYFLYFLYPCFCFLKKKIHTHTQKPTKAKVSVAFQIFGCCPVCLHLDSCVVFLMCCVWVLCVGVVCGCWERVTLYHWQHLSNSVLPSSFQIPRTQLWISERCSNTGNWLLCVCLKWIDVVFIHAIFASIWPVFTPRLWQNDCLGLHLKLFLKKWQVCTVKKKLW
jgi:hypothetical protein